MSHLFDVLTARAARGSSAPHGDGLSIALVVEGGAMRGVVSAGMMWALEDLGLGRAFDAVYGSSAGSINSAYFLAGQAGLGTRIYFEDINNRSFIDLGRPLRRRPIVDLGFLLDDVARHRKRLDADRVVHSPTPLTVMATDVDAEAPHGLRDFGDAVDLFGALRAGATMPIVAGEPFTYRNHRYLDASLSQPIPVPMAEHDGHTHVVALLTRAGGMRPRPSAFDRYLVGPRLHRVSPTLAARYLARAQAYAVVLHAIDAGTGPLGRAQVMAIRATGADVSKLERRRPVLEAGARRGYDSVMAAFRNGRT